MYFNESITLRKSSFIYTQGHRVGIRLGVVKVVNLGVV